MSSRRVARPFLMILELVLEGMGLEVKELEVIGTLVPLILIVVVPRAWVDDPLFEFVLEARIGAKV